MVTCQPFEVQYENRIGAQTIEKTKKDLNICLDAIFNFQDNVRFSIGESQRQTDYAIIQSNAIIENMERYVFSTLDIVQFER